MTSPRVEVLLWARRVIARKTAEPHVLLEINADATVDQAQEAFHKLARVAHPDLHRTSLSPEDLEIVTSAYAHAANAYQQFRTAKLQTGKVAVVKPAAAPTPPAKPRGAAVTLPGGGVIRGTGTTRPPPIGPAVSRTSTGSVAPPPAATTLAPAPEPPPSAATHAASQMNSKALLHYRKAELALRRGDIRGGLLNLKMAIAADPQSSFLRSALTEVEAELAKKP